MTAPQHQIHIKSFLFCFFAAPLLVTGLTFWAFIPIYALIFGGPFYVVIGLPALWWFLRRYPPQYLPILGMALTAQLLTFPLLGLMALWHGDNGPIEAIPSILVMGCLFGGAWSLVFTLLYRRFIRDL